MPSKRTIRLSIIALAAILSFLGSLPNEIFWDDEILLNQRLTIENCGGFGDIWKQPYWGIRPGPADTYRPLSLSLIYSEKLAFGDRYAVFRVVSLSLHASNCLLVYLLVSKLAGKGAGWPAALLFAVHPVHTEAVAMIYGQLELVSFLFMMLAVLAYLRGLDASSKTKPMLLALAFGFLAYFSKESALMLPALLMLTRLCHTNSDLADRYWTRRILGGMGWEILFGLIALPYLILRFRALGGLTPDAANTVSAGYTLTQRLHAVIVAVAHGLRLCTIPTGQTLYYGHLRDSIFGRPSNEILWLVIAGVIGWMLVSDIGRRAVFFGLGWFLLALLPVANIIPGGVLVAERTLYLPSFGLCFIGGVLVDRAIDKKLLKPSTIRLLFALVILSYAIASARVTLRLRSAEPHWRSTVGFYPRSPLAHLELGGAILERLKKSGGSPGPSELNEADDHFRIAFEQNPALAEALVGQAFIAKLRGDRAGIEALWIQLRETNPQASKEIEDFRKLMQSQ